VRKMKEKIEHAEKKLVGRREVENPDKQGWDGLTGWLKTE